MSTSPLRPRVCSSDTHCTCHRCTSWRRRRESLQADASVCGRGDHQGRRLRVGQNAARRRRESTLSPPPAGDAEGCGYGTRPSTLAPKQRQCPGMPFSAGFQLRMAPPLPNSFRAQYGTRPQQECPVRGFRAAAASPNRTNAGCPTRGPGRSGMTFSDARELPCLQIV